MQQLKFPHYTAAERSADRAVHLAGVTAAPLAALWLVRSAALEIGASAALVLAIYGAGLVATFAASAAYNLAPPSPLKGRLRRLDHAMIFVMIAGSYTPFATFALTPRLGMPLCAGVWALALLGIAMTLCLPRPRERLSLALYLVMGWLVLLVIWPLARVLPPSGLMLLLAGGVVYSLGTLAHTRDWPFHNAVWHALVLAAASLHFFAIAHTFRLV